MSRRDRQRRRRAANPGPRPSEPHRDNVPGSLDHASGDVDEFEAAIVAGADGQAEVEDDPAAELDTISEEELEAAAEDSDPPEDATVVAGGGGRAARTGRPTAMQPAGHGGG